MNPLTYSIDDAAAGKRLDLFLKIQLPDRSRAQLQDWIKDSKVLLNGQKVKTGHLLKCGDRVTVTPVERPPLAAQAEDLPVAVLYRDEAVIAVDKPAGMVVHSGAGVHSGTLVNALLHHFGQLSSTGGEDRPGIVHRLDKLTSGVLLVARNDAAHQHLAAQFSGREVEKTYIALVEGTVPKDSGRIDKPIARDPAKRIKMTVRLDRGRTAWSEYRVLRRLAKYTLLEVTIGTGRTHQIRVHLSSIGHPVAGDRLYGAASQPDKERFFLHALRIRFTSPATRQPVTVEAPLPPELEQWLASLQ
ncbi:MAG: RluA family pseudouridine synthase [Bryobacterales bacterium]|nr:RluA family pseudouridine synthase [Bryobacterales bacterium]